MKAFIFLTCFIITLIGVINSASTTGRVSTTGRGTTPRTSPWPTQRTSTTPRSLTCYSCASCPLPFTSSSPYVGYEYTYGRWCEKRAFSESRDAPATRGADKGFCRSRGCSWTTINGIQQYLCCCDTNYCNSAVSTSKSSIIILLLSSIIFIFLNKNL